MTLPLTAKRRFVAIRMYKAKASVDAIVAETSCGREAIRRMLKREGLIRPRRRLSKEVKEEAKRLYRAGKGPKEIAAILPISKGYIRALVKGHKEVSRPKPSRTVNFRPKRRRCLCCQSLFSSQGPHERICKPCKSVEGYRNAQTLLGYPCDGVAA